MRAKIDCRYESVKPLDPQIAQISQIKNRHSVKGILPSLLLNL